MFEIRAYPEFSWSISRQRQLDSCPRAYYYRYYLTHNGWLSDAPERARLAYRLSKLTTLDALFGQQMDERAREVEASVRSGGPVPEASELEERTRQVLRLAWRSSRDGRAAFEARPKDNLMLTSFYLKGCPPEDGDVGRLNEKLGTCHRHLAGTSHWQRLRECGDEGCVLIPAFAHCFVDGIKVFGAGDLAYVHNSTLFLIDWKSGRPGPDDHFQVMLATYCLKAGDASLAELPVRATLEYLQTGEQQPVSLPDDDHAEMIARLRTWFRGMRSYLRDVDANAPVDESEFPRKESGLCRSCNFRPFCEREA
jgi:hypothetical protein